MIQVSGILLALTVALALSTCGKKKEDEATSTPTAVAKLSITCGGKSCIGTEGQ